MDNELEEGEIPSPSRSNSKETKDIDYYEVISDDSDEMPRRKKRKKPHGRCHRHRQHRSDDSRSLASATIDFDRTRRKLFQKLKAKRAAEEAEEACKEIPATEIAEVEMQDVSEPIVVIDSDEEVDVEVLRCRALHSQTQTVKPEENKADEIENEFVLRAEALKTAIMKKRQVLRSKQCLVKSVRLKGAANKNENCEEHNGTDGKKLKESIGVEGVVEVETINCIGSLTPENEQNGGLVDFCKVEGVLSKPDELIPCGSKPAENIGCEIMVVTTAIITEDKSDPSNFPVLLEEINAIPLPPTLSSIPVDSSNEDCDEVQLRALLLNGLKNKRSHSNSPVAELNGNSPNNHKLPVSDIEKDLSQIVSVVQAVQKAESQEVSKRESLEDFAGRASVALAEQKVNIQEKSNDQIINDPGKGIAAPQKEVSLEESNCQSMKLQRKEMSTTSRRNVESQKEPKTECSKNSLKPLVNKLFNNSSKLGRVNSVPLVHNSNIHKVSNRLSPVINAPVLTQQIKSVPTKVTVNPAFKKPLIAGGTRSESAIPTERLLNVLKKSPVKAPRIVNGGAQSDLAFPAKQRPNPFSLISPSLKKPVVQKPKQLHSTEETSIKERIVIKLGEDSSEDEIDMTPKDKLTSSLDEFLEEAKRRCETNKHGAAIPSTPEAVYAHLPPSQRLEYLRLKKKLAEAEQERTKKKVLAATIPKPEVQKLIAPVQANESEIKKSDDIEKVLPKLNCKESPSKLCTKSITRSTKTKRLINAQKAPVLSKKGSRHPMSGIVNRMLHYLAQLRKEAALEKIARNEIERLNDQLSVLKQKRQAHQTRMELLRSRVQRVLTAVEKAETPVEAANLSTTGSTLTTKKIASEVQEVLKPANEEPRLPGLENGGLFHYSSPLNSAISEVQVDPFKELCPHDLAGVCRDLECPYQHPKVRLAWYSRKNGPPLLKPCVEDTKIDVESLLSDKLVNPSSFNTLCLNLMALKLMENTSELIFYGRLEYGLDLCEINGKQVFCGCHSLISY